jgi:hypothetical protein
VLVRAQTAGLRLPLEQHGVVLEVENDEATEASPPLGRYRAAGGGIARPKKPRREVRTYAAGPLSGTGKAAGGLERSGARDRPLFLDDLQIAHG